MNPTEDEDGDKYSFPTLSQDVEVSNRRLCLYDMQLPHSHVLQLLHYHSTKLIKQTQKSQITKVNNKNGMCTYSR
jgi:hypothetical protein